MKNFSAIGITLILIWCSVVKASKMNPLFDARRAPFVVDIKYGDSRASGTILKKIGSSTYLIVTSDHSLYQPASYPCIGFGGGRYYQGSIVKRGDQNIDLAFIIVNADAKEDASSIELATSGIQIGERVISYGYDGLGAFLVKSGRVKLYLVPALTGSYSLGIDAIIEKGMSGGAIVNSSGKLLGINAIHPYPLWDADIYYENSQKAGTSMKEQIEKLTMAIEARTVGRTMRQIRWSPINVMMRKC